ncbi:MAG: TIGR03905 family TSCPD domain-containing protein [Bacteroidales bacterium]|nr:TIGR03905 family TSCPD domain-containing protein [Bacteroidales bacterium]
MFEVTLISDKTEGGIRKASFLTCGVVCSSQIDIELEGDTLKSVRYTGGCNGNLQGIGALVAGMNKDEVIDRLSGINCKGRGTSCPDQLSRALKML